MKNLYLPLLTLLLVGAGCIAAVPSDTDPAAEAVCNFEGFALQAGEGLIDTCNTHTCQEDGTVISTEMACERTNLRRIEN